MKKILLIVLTAFAVSACSQTERKVGTEILSDYSESVDLNSNLIDNAQVLQFISNRLAEVESDSKFTTTHFAVNITSVGQSEIRKVKPFTITILPHLLSEVSYPESRKQFLLNIENYLTEQSKIPRNEKYTFLASGISSSLKRLADCSKGYVLIISDGREDDGKEVRFFKEFDPKNIKTVKFDSLANKVRFDPPPKQLPVEVIFLHESSIYDPITEKSNKFWQYLLQPYVEKVSRLASLN